jgi:hypothetical protein
MAFGVRPERISKRTSVPAWTFEKSSVSSKLVAEFSLSLPRVDDPILVYIVIEAC